LRFIEPQLLLKLKRTYARNPAEMAAKRSRRHIDKPRKFRKIKSLPVMIAWAIWLLGLSAVSKSLNPPLP
jgi:hypothetical protein